MRSIRKLWAPKNTRSAWVVGIHDAPPIHQPIAHEHYLLAIQDRLQALIDATGNDDLIRESVRRVEEIRLLPIILGCNREYWGCDIIHSSLPQYVIGENLRGEFTRETMRSIGEENLEHAAECFDAWITQLCAGRTEHGL